MSGNHTLFYFVPSSASVSTLRYCSWRTSCLPGAVWTWRVSPSEWVMDASRLICLRSRVLAPSLSLRNEITPWLEARISVTSCVLRAAAGSKSNLLSVDASRPRNDVGLATFEKTLVVWFLFPTVTSLCSYKMIVTYLSLSGRVVAGLQYYSLILSVLFMQTSTVGLLTTSV